MRISKSAPMYRTIGMGCLSVTYSARPRRPFLFLGLAIDGGGHSFWKERNGVEEGREGVGKKRGLGSLGGGV